MTKRVLVTGGAGFVGANLVRVLGDGGWTIRVLDDFRTGREEYVADLGVEVVRGEIGDLPLVTDLAAGVDAIIHLAAAGSVVDSVADPVANFDANVRGTFSVLNAARAAGIARLVFSSTGGALIGNATPPVNEQSLPKPISPYGAGKLAAEAYCHAFAKSYGMTTVALRFANVYGPYSGHKKGAITVFLRALHEGRPLQIYGDGKASRDFMYVDDICRGIELGLTRDLRPGTVAHLATGVETSVWELADACRRVVGLPDHPIELLPPRPGEVDRNFAAFDYAREILGFEPSVALDEGLALTWDWYQRYVF
ncbi:MAG: UDP-glucose 4-epimerase [Pseudonocardiales bacterium]|nr:UDP-glucose 4-epimerase [Pseudonocardiales bacterium]MDT4921069.1 UDP-glucose 4-epimerase [Pseudonocardiales bacterium]